MLFEWDEEKNQINVSKHGIDFRIAVKVFDDQYLFDVYDEEHSGYNKYGMWEDRYIALGYVDNVLYVVYTVKERNNEDIIRLISARNAEEPEIRAYVINKNKYL